MERTLQVVQTLRMARGEVGRVLPRRGTVVRVLRGRVWLTAYGGGRDWALDCDAVHPIETPGVAVLECAAPAIIEVLAPLPRWRATLAAARASGRLARCLSVSVVRSAFRRGNPA